MLKLTALVVRGVPLKPVKVRLSQKGEGLYFARLRPACTASAFARERVILVRIYVGTFSVVQQHGLKCIIC